jgi:hypothetical protein
LALHGLIDRPHATVQTTLQQLAEAGWQPAQAPIPGAVVLWPADQRGHEHIGFYLDAQTYMSNASSQRQPTLHSAQLTDGRRPTGYYIHPALV